MHIYGIWKDGTDEIICRAAMETWTIKNRLVDLMWWGLEGRGGEGWRERVGCMRITRKFTLAYVKQIPRGNLLYGSGSSNSDSDNLERWNGEGDGKEVQEGRDMCVPVTHSC